MKKIIKFLAVACLISTSACSESSNKNPLTEDQVRKLTSELSEVYKKPLNEAEKIIKSSYTDDVTFVFTSTMTPEITLTKKQYLANLEKSHAMAQDADIVYKVDNIKISNDKKLAIVTDTATIQKQLADPNQKDKKLTLKAITKCEKTVVLSDDNTPQIKNVKCKSQPQEATPSQK